MAHKNMKREMHIKTTASYTVFQNTALVWFSPATLAVPHELLVGSFLHP
jgi:hypothetical protein